MKAEDVKQYEELKAKKTLSTEEQAVVVAYDKATEALDVLEDAQEALVKAPSTTV